MNLTRTRFPLTIDNQQGESLTFLGMEDDKILVENTVEPGCGPVMHTHYQQDESLTVTSGKMGYELLGDTARFAYPGETVTFLRGKPHRFWNAGEETLTCSGWISPPNSIVYFLSALYAAQQKSGDMRPDPFDGAYLVTRYASEYDLPEIPGFVKKVIMPITVWIGNLFGKYKHFTDAPAPLPPIKIDR